MKKRKGWPFLFCVETQGMNRNKVSVSHESDTDTLLVLRVDNGNVTFFTGADTNGIV